MNRYNQTGGSNAFLRMFSCTGVVSCTGVGGAMILVGESREWVHVWGYGSR